MCKSEKANGVSRKACERKRQPYLQDRGGVRLRVWRLRVCLIFRVADSCKMGGGHARGWGASQSTVRAHVHTHATPPNPRLRSPPLLHRIASVPRRRRLPPSGVRRRRRGSWSGTSWSCRPSRQPRRRRRSGEEERWR